MATKKSKSDKHLILQSQKQGSELASTNLLQPGAADACKLARSIERTIKAIKIAAQQTLTIQQNDGGRILDHHGAAEEFCTSSAPQLPQEDAWALDLPAEKASRCLERLPHNLEELKRLLETPSIATALQAVHKNSLVPVGDEAYPSYCHAAFEIGGWLYGLFLFGTNGLKSLNEWLYSEPHEKRFESIATKDFDAVFRKLCPEIVRRMSAEKDVDGLHKLLIGEEDQARENEKRAKGKGKPGPQKRTKQNVALAKEYQEGLASGKWLNRNQFANRMVEDRVLEGIGRDGWVKRLNAGLAALERPKK